MGLTHKGGNGPRNGNKKTKNAGKGEKKTRSSSNNKKGRSVPRKKGETHIVNGPCKIKLFAGKNSPGKTKNRELSDEEGHYRKLRHVREDHWGKTIASEERGANRGGGIVHKKRKNSNKKT